MSRWGLFWRGLAMGLADVIPGVSGGTVAFITGVYEPLSGALHSLLQGGIGLFTRKPRAGTKVAGALSTLVPLGVGVAAGILSMLRPLQLVLQSTTARPVLMALFLGLMTGSILLCLRWFDWRRARLWVLMLFGAALGWSASSHTVGKHPGVWAAQLPVLSNVYADNVHEGWVTGLSERQVQALVRQQCIVIADGQLRRTDGLEGQSVRASETWDPFLIGAVAWALCAMLLPGISGTYMLQLAGQYERILDAIDRGIFGLLAGSWDGMAWATIGQVMLGLLLGAMLFATVIRWTWQRFPEPTMALLTGLMVGGVHVLWPWREVHRVWDPVREQLLSNWGSLVPPSTVIDGIGMGIVWLIGLLALIWVRRRIDAVRVNIPGMATTEPYLEVRHGSIQGDSP